MMTMKKWMALLAAAMLAVIMIGCEEVGDAANETGEAMEDAADATGDAMEDAADSMDGDM